MISFRYQLRRYGRRCASGFLKLQRNKSRRTFADQRISRVATPRPEQRAANLISVSNLGDGAPRFQARRQNLSLLLQRPIATTAATRDQLDTAILITKALGTVLMSSISTLFGTQIRHLLFEMAIVQHSLMRREVGCSHRLLSCGGLVQLLLVDLPALQTMQEFDRALRMAGG